MNTQEKKDQSPDDFVSSEESLRGAQEDLVADKKHHAAEKAHEQK